MGINSRTCVETPENVKLVLGFTTYLKCGFNQMAANVLWPVFLLPNLKKTKKIDKNR